MNQALLQVKGLKKSFNGIEVLHSVDFSAEAGKVTALAGENGAGKSTLMKILMGEYQADGGEFEQFDEIDEISYEGNALTYGQALTPVKHTRQSDAELKKLLDY